MRVPPRQNTVNWSMSITNASLPDLNEKNISRNQKRNTKQTEVNETNERGIFSFCFVYFRLFRVSLLISLLTQLSPPNKISHFSGAHRGRSSETIHLLIRFRQFGGIF